jgi:hypothetical protein
VAYKEWDNEGFAMIIPFIDGVLSQSETVEIGAGFSIITLPHHYIVKLAERKEIVANYESSLDKLKAGLQFEPKTSQIKQDITVLEQVKVCIFAGMLIRLTTGKPIDMPFWLDAEDRDEIRGFGQTLVRTYRTGPRDTYKLDDELALERMNNLSKGVDRLVELFIREKDKNRIIRGIEFVSIGFQTFHIPTRIVNQVTFLETLFTTSRNEITFQLASRLSWYLATSDAIRREDKFNLVKNIYDARSRVVHGEHTNNPVRNLMKWLIEAEELNTEVFNVILAKNHIDAFSASEKRRERELKKLTIGVPCDFLDGGNRIQKAG